MYRQPKKAKKMISVAAASHSKKDDIGSQSKQGDVVSQKKPEDVSSQIKKDDGSQSQKNDDSRQNKDDNSKQDNSRKRKAAGSLIKISLCLFVQFKPSNFRNQ